MLQTLKLDGKPYFNFINSLKSDFTKINYRYALSRFLKHYNLTINGLANTGPKDIETLLIDYIVLLKQNKKSMSAINTIVSSITHFCVMNDVNIMTNKIAKFNMKPSVTTTEDIHTKKYNCLLILRLSGLKLFSLLWRQLVSGLVLYQYYDYLT